MRLWFCQWLGLGTVLIYLSRYLDQEAAKLPFRSSSQAATCYYRSNHSKVKAIPLSALPTNTTKLTCRTIIGLLAYNWRTFSIVRFFFQSVYRLQAIHQLHQRSHCFTVFMFFILGLDLTNAINIIIRFMSLI